MGKFKPNGFVIFANEYKRTHNVQYYNYRELLDVVSPFWNELPETEKDRYKERAKADAKRQELKRIRTSSIEDVQEKRLKLVNEEEDKKQRIEDLVYTASDLGELDDMIFYFVNISTFFEDSNDIYPAELAMSKYSLRKGIIDTLHIKINPGELPLGSTFPAQEKANQTHKYLLPTDNEDSDYDFGESSYILILMKIIDFIDPIEDAPIENLPLFFTEGSSVTDNNILKNIQKAFVRIFEKAGEYDIASDLKLYSVVDLIYYLNKVSNTSEINPEDKKEHFTSLSNADEAFRRTDRLFRYIAQGCTFHEENDVLNYCCLSRVRCYGYIISKYCVNSFKYPLIEGRHFPTDFHVEP
ncbi:protein maelstrom homolog [Chironomus tepperi]|uniref:protein maelstrom homolog n=1 Tax=Chironomus tepperi TaxID=113505 RepID=UPI00391EF37D